MVSAVLDGDEIREIGLRQQRHLSLSLLAAIVLHLLLALVWAGFEFDRTTSQPLLLEPPMIRAMLVAAPAPLPVVAKQEPAPVPVTPPPGNSVNRPPSQLAATPQKLQPLSSAAAPQRVTTVAEQRATDVSEPASDTPVVPQTNEVGMVPESYVPPSSQIAYGSNPKPNYPQAAKRRGMEGVVEVLVRVDEKGMAVAVELKHSSGFSVLDREALKAVAQWRFEPARRGDVAVTGEVVVPIRFRLDEP